MGWANERDYDAIIFREATRQGVPYALIKAVIAQESNFTARAIRGEPQLADASRGLMQLLYSTAKALGYTGTPDGLFDPSVNIAFGTKLLKGNLARVAGDEAAAVSMYNGGYRPSLGFGARVTKPTTVCLARDQQTGVCIRKFTAQPGQFGNQPHVDKVMAYFNRYKLEVPNIPKGTVPAVVDPSRRPA